MRALTASEHLQVWEWGSRRPPVQRALYLLTAATSLKLDDLAQLPLGRRDSLLLRLRELMFGPRVEAVAACPECRDELEMSFDIADVLPDVAVAHEADNTGHVLVTDGLEVRFRLPNSLDMESISGCPGEGDARAMLLGRCVLKVSGGELTAPVIDQLAEKMSELDSQANISLQLTCPSCRYEWSTVFDIVPYLWTEVSDRAKRILREVHLLASAYSWSERDILEMSAERRRLYLERLDMA